MSDIVPVVLLIILVLLIVLSTYHYKRMAAALDYASEREFMLMEQMVEMRQVLGRAFQSIYRTAGGVEKRLMENLAIAEEIDKYAPELFEKCPAMPFWILANDEFLTSLHIATTVHFHETEQQRVVDMALRRARTFGQLSTFSGIKGAMRAATRPHVHPVDDDHLSELDAVEYLQILATVGKVIADATNEFPAPVPINVDANDPDFEQIALGFSMTIDRRTIANAMNAQASLVRDAAAGYNGKNGAKIIAVLNKWADQRTAVANRITGAVRNVAID